MERDEGHPANTDRCAEAGCSESAAVRLHVPWDENREVCAGHARALAQREGVVAEPLDERGSEWP